jgi:hypothetical protein
MAYVVREGVLTIAGDNDPRISIWYGGPSMMLCIQEVRASTAEAAWIKDVTPQCWFEVRSDRRGAK